MANELTIRVVYPLKAGRIVLRTEADWNASVQADRVSDDGTTYEFPVSTRQPYFYFKPCIEDANGRHWSKGDNYLAVLGLSKDKDVYPHFFGGLTGEITPPSAVPGTETTETHAVRVYLPPGYAENTLKRYPVLYMHDGKNLFFPDEAFGGQEWRIDETMGALDSMNIIDKVIVVGVYPVDREREYTKPGYERYGRYLVEALKPAIDARFRTLAGPATTAVMGSSLGGVVSLYLALQWPEVFGKAACMSSTFTWRDDLMQRVAEEPRRDVKLYLDSGWPRDNYEVTRSMRNVLARKGWVFGQDLLYFAFPNAIHSERDWALRSHLPFQFFFGKTPVFQEA